MLFANGVTLDTEEKYVYVAESLGKCVVRYEVFADGSLGRPEQYGPEFSEFGHPDGCAFDSAGNLWVTLVVMNALVASDFFLVPVSAEYLPMVGLTLLGNSIGKIQKLADVYRASGVQRNLG